MSRLGRTKNLSFPDETIELPGVTEYLVEVGEMTVGRAVQEPGWRWSTHVRPVVGGDWCEAHHIGVVLSGSFGVTFRDGSTLELRANDVYDIPAGHDGYTIGDEECVLLEWSGLRTFARGRMGYYGRILATLLFTDIVDSTASASRMGDIAWRELLDRHYQAVRSHLERFHGREVVTTGDGLLAMFESPASALTCADAIRHSAGRAGVGLRLGLHVGEVDLVGSDVRGIAVHQAARVMSHGREGEVVVTEQLRMLTAASGFEFEDRGVHELKGIPEPVRLWALRKEPAPRP